MAIKWAYSLELDRFIDIYHAYEASVNGEIQHRDWFYCRWHECAVRLTLYNFGKPYSKLKASPRFRVKNKHHIDSCIHSKNFKGSPKNIFTKNPNIDVYNPERVLTSISPNISEIDLANRIKKAYGRYVNSEYDLAYTSITKFVENYLEGENNGRSIRIENSNYSYETTFVSIKDLNLAPNDTPKVFYGNAQVYKGRSEKQPLYKIVYEEKLLIDDEQAEVSLSIWKNNLKGSTYEKNWLDKLEEISSQRLSVKCFILSPRYEIKNWNERNFTNLYFDSFNQIELYE